MRAGPSDSIFHFVGPKDPVVPVINPLGYPTSPKVARTVQAGMYWLDTSGVRLRLRRRNEDNTAWIDVAGATVQGSPSLNLSWNEVTAVVTGSVIPEGVDHAALANRGTDSHPQYLLKTEFAHGHDHGALTGLGDDDHMQYLLRTDFPSLHKHSTLSGLANDDHPQYVPKALVDAKGDLLVASADNVPARLPVGANGMVLTADATKSTGLAWKQTPIDISFGPFYLAGIAANDTAEMFLSYASSDKLVEPGPAGTSDYLIPAAGAVVGVWLNADLPWTAGTAEMRVRKNGQILPFAGGACKLDTGHRLRASAIDWVGVPVAAGDTIGLTVVTTGWAPTSSNARARVVVRMMP